MDQELQLSAAKIWYQTLNHGGNFHLAMGGDPKIMSQVVLIAESPFLTDSVDQGFLGWLTTIKSGVILFRQFSGSSEAGNLTGLVHPEASSGKIRTYRIEPFRNTFFRSDCDTPLRPSRQCYTRIYPEPRIARQGYTMTVHRYHEDHLLEGIPNSHWNERLKPFLETHLPINP